MANTLKLVFKSDANKMRMITIYNPIDGLDDAGVSKAMDDILSTNVLDTSEGKASMKHQAYLEAKERQKFNINAQS